ncbi:BTAD domain-containing putative transcriptional regulator [Kutzneria buriramensis]|uniref:DNA-binding SARP family transcriptional activator n=1 Tax=Kutzneria buriramensis TaxID=1045776 RepID=A0A3E0GZG2_9PSEU|nr:BTAD domain-containing putative transcriptional regulator [Kutzneria buriramensis]REH35773.1 DNA-binding SARP family transcriptional activator [Kutzneria buriramensis]
MEFLILGPLEARSQGHPIRVVGTRQRKLLALLLLNLNRVVTFEHLVDELWDTPPDSVRQQVHNAVGSLRRNFAASAEDVRVTTTEAGYRLDASASSVDREEFGRRIREAKIAESHGRVDAAITHLRAALAMWRGDVLSGLRSPSIDIAATSLQEQRLTAVEDLASLRLRAGEANAIVGELRGLVAEHPLRESLRGTLMLALHLSGRQADALDVYDRGRRLMAEELGLDPGPQLRAVQSAILNGTAEAVVSGPGSLPVDSPTREEPNEASSVEEVAGRCLLPRDTRDFSGRATELVQLVSEAKSTLPTALVISAIDGMGGVGKTTLAVHLAHRIAQDFPDGQYFIDLHGFSLGVEPVTSEQALDTLLRACGVPVESVPADLDNRLAHWRSRMAGKRAVIILDNALDAAQIRPLLPGTPGILVIVTSRRRLTALEGIVPLSLDVLPIDDARTLFTQIIGEDRAAAEPEAVATAVELCGRLPLAIRIAAARLRDRQGWLVADLVERLDSQARRKRFLQTGDRGVMSALRLSCRYLSDQQYRLFRLLGLHPGPDFDAYAAAALAGLPLDEAEVFLETLLDDNLVRQDTVGRYYFHDLVRDCANELCTGLDSEEDRRAAEGRLLSYYLQSADTWGKHLKGDGPRSTDVEQKVPGSDYEPNHVKTAYSSDEAMRLLDVEYANIRAVAHLAADDGWHRLCWQLVGALHPYLKSRNYAGNTRALLEKGLRAAEADNDLNGQSVCLHVIAAACRQRGSTAEARRYIERALALSRRTGDTYREAAQLTDLGFMYHTDDQLQKAYETYRLAEEILARGRSTSLNAVIANNLGVICRDLGRFEEAATLGRRALEIEKANGEFPRRTTLKLWNIGMVLHFQGQHRQAERTFEQVGEASRRASFETGTMTSLLGLCYTGRALGNLESALDNGRQALALARRIGIRKSECEILNTLGEAMFSTGDLEKAGEIFERAQEYSLKYGFARHVARSYEGLAHIAWTRQRLEQAQSHWTQALESYPDGMIDADYARRHLDSLTDSNADCVRCRIAIRSD